MTDRLRTKQYGIRRAFALLFGLVIAEIANHTVGESDMFLHAIDDYIDIVAAVIALAVILLWWKRDSLPELKKTNNVLTALAVVVILATIFAITQESSDPEDFGNEIPTLIYGIFLLINRFI